MTDLKPGRELDALIAEKVMGCTSAPNDAYPGEYDCRCNGLAHEDSERGGLLCFSTDIAAAWEVVEKLTEKWHIQINSCITEGDASTGLHWACEVDVKRAPIEVVADSAPHAICLAALKAKGL